MIEALNGPYAPRANVLPLESPDTPDADNASATQAAEVLNRSKERTPISKNTLSKENESSPRMSSTSCSTPEFRMSILLAKGENSGSQKEHNRSPVIKNKSCGHSRDKNNTRLRDSLKLVNEKQHASQYEVTFFIHFYPLHKEY